MDTKECRECKEQINKKATKCPNCGSSQRSYIARHPIKTILWFIFVVIVISITLASNNDSRDDSLTQSATNLPPNVSNTAPATIAITQADIDELQADLDGWAEGRWSNVIVKKGDDGVIVEAYVMSQANQVAIDSYCQVLKDSARSAIPSGNRVNLFVYQNGEIAKACI
jgi:hypothetical protein